MNNMDPNNPIDISTVNYRLMQEWELPERIKVKPEDPNKAVEELG
jgi:hypothetical protein